MYNICCIGHITLDKVVNSNGSVHMAGGTSYYFSKALRHMNVSYSLVTSLAQSEMQVADELRNQGITVKAFISTHSVYFENIYSDNQDHRTQRVLQKADAFTIEQLNDVEAEVFHLGPLLADDISPDVVSYLATKGKISLDVQGYLRKVQGYEVCAVDWSNKRETLRYVHILKANDHELEVLTGTNDTHKGAQILASWGVKEVVVTLGGMGSVIYAEGIFYTIPAYKPSAVVDATGCGDTYMAGYLYQRNKGAGIQQAGEFAAAMASLKIQALGPFNGNGQTVTDFLAMQN
ncbi:PfkB family carbohydrate kinase [Mucilaginibacter terrae]|uniref:PfkB family carbohydrate kinase n=1 Tax=Mucilaginibacter terrae TaxID=1955052 RepID=UPI00363E443E